MPSEPLVVAPYDAVGTYGGTLDVLSNATEAGTSDFLSVRHVNLVRYSDDLQTIVPNVAKSWSWNADNTELTFKLRAGHRWSDGAPFTSADVAFWYNDLMMNTNVFEKPKDYALVAGERMTVETPDPQTVIFKLPAPKPGSSEPLRNLVCPGLPAQALPWPVYAGDECGRGQPGAGCRLRGWLCGDPGLLWFVGLDRHAVAAAELA